MQLIEGQKVFIVPEHQQAAAKALHTWLMDTAPSFENVQQEIDEGIMVVRCATSGAVCRLRLPSEDAILQYVSLQFVSREMDGRLKLEGFLQLPAIDESQDDISHLVSCGNAQFDLFVEEHEIMVPEHN